MIGAMVLGKMRNNPRFEQQVLAELDKFLERDIDRKLFDLVTSSRS